MTITAGVEWERSLGDGGLVAGMDEVGRGAIAGPVAVGLCVSGPDDPPAGLADSKLLTARRREQLFVPVCRWAVAASVGMATPDEIDRLGVTAALQLAGWRALESLLPAHRPTTIILDGSHNWLSARDGGAQWEVWAGLGCPEVVTQVKADLTCAVVAAASIIAKVSRDNLMSSLPDRGYGWAKNKGYAAASHREGLARLGPDSLHRLSWKLPGLEASGGSVSAASAGNSELTLWP